MELRIQLFFLAGDWGQGRNPDSLTWGERRNMDKYYLFTFVEVLSIVWLKKGRARITLNGADHNISFSFQTLITFSVNFLNF